MTCEKGKMGQFMVDQTPRYDNRSRGRRPNQAMSKAGIIRPDKRKKVKFI